MPTATPGTGLGPVWWTLIGAAALLVVVLGLLLIRRRRRRWSPAGRTPEQLALLSQAEVDRALRRAGAERPLWQPIALFFEDLNPPGTHRGGAESDAPSPANDPSASLIEDSVTVGRAADAALFDPIVISDERSRAAYQAALRVRKGLRRLQSTPRNEDDHKGRHGAPRTGGGAATRLHSHPND